MSDCCLMSIEELLSYIMARTSGRLFQIGCYPAAEKLGSISVTLDVNNLHLTSNGDMICLKDGKYLENN